MIALLFIALAFAAVWADAFSEPWPRRVLSVLAGAVGLYGIWMHSPPIIGEWFESLRWYSLVLLGSMLVWVVIARRTEEKERLRADGGRVLMLVAWGFLQQALMLAFLLPEVGAVWAVSIFTAMHLPNWRLALVTLAGGIVSVLIYRDAPSLIVPGVMHAMLSALLSALPDRFNGDMQIGPRYLEWKARQ